MIASVDNSIAKARFTIVKPMCYMHHLSHVIFYPNQIHGIAVLYMPANCIGKICVRYSNSNDFPEPIGITVSNPNNMKSKCLQELQLGVILQIIQFQKEILL